MTRSQFIFSLASGATLALSGYALASAAVIDWGLFWVGVGVAAVTLADRLQRTSSLLPATVKAEH